jgi:hypothetical protein
MGMKPIAVGTILDVGVAVSGQLRCLFPSGKDFFVCVGNRTVANLEFATASDSGFIRHAMP